MAAPPRAIVVGASMAGLLAARVLADHVDDVAVLERDDLPDGAEHRRGVPQARHVHVLLQRGLTILEQLFPGLRAELLAGGAVDVDVVADLAVLGRSGWAVRVPSDVHMVSCSRALLESTVRRRLRALPNVTLQTGLVVSGLLADGSGAVTGVVAGGTDGSAPARRHAGLVVDASGRGSRAPDWLAALGYPRPVERAVDAAVTYATRLYERPPDVASGWEGVYLQTAAPAWKRGGVLLPIEGRRWLLTLVGLGGDHPPRDEAGFDAFAAGLRSPAIADAIARARPASPIRRYQATQNRLRRYERLRRFPDGFAVLGDAAFAFNPVYGQGMTTAAVGALALDRCLREQRRRPAARGLGRRFQRRLARVNAGPWLLATSEDFRLPETVGGSATPAVRLVHAYLDHVTALCVERPAVIRRFAEVVHMVRPPSALLAPTVSVPVAGRVLRRRRAVTVTDAAQPAVSR